MILSLLVFITSLVLVYLSSHLLIKNLIKFFYRLSRSRHTSINLLFFVLLPGIFLHEFSHILSAEILQVRTGHLSLKPQFQHNQLTLGSAQIARTDPIRLTLIGLAPFITGTLTLWLLLKFCLNLNISTITFSTLIPQFISSIQQLSPIVIIGTFYLIFAITNTMFSSPSDLQAAGLPVILFLIITTILKLSQFSLPTALITYSTNLFLLLSTIFFLTLFLNLIFLLPLKIFNRH